MESKMGDYRNSGGQRDMVCIDTNRVLDSCRDKDCFENVRVYLTDFGQQIVDRASVVRAKCAEVEWACIDIDSVPFNRGFYQLLIRIYTRVTCEACVGPGNTQEFDGIAAVEKKVILFGGEGMSACSRASWRERASAPAARGTPHRRTPHCRVPRCR